MKILFTLVFLLGVFPVQAAGLSEVLSGRVQQAQQDGAAAAQEEFVALINSNKAFSWQELEALIRRGADVNAFSFEGGRTALMVAVENVGAKFILLDGGSADRQSEREAQANQRRAGFARIAYLIKAGANVNPRVKDGKNSPYLLLAAVGDSNVFSMLLEGLALQKGNPDLADDNGLRPIDLAAKQQKAAAYKLLVKAGANAQQPSAALGGKSPKAYLEEQARQASGGDEASYRRFLEPFGY